VIPVANAKLKLEEDVEFIFSEAARFRKLERQWLETKKAPAELKEGYLWEIPFPDDEQKKLPIGRAAMARLEDLANLASLRARIDSQVDVLTVRQPLGQSLIRRFVLEGRPITVQHIERAMSEAARKATKKLHTTTHYIPCHLMIAQEPARFALGPVAFLRRSEFRALLAKRLWASRAEHRSNWQFLGDAARYYKSFGWVAEVTVPNCDEKTSERVAQSAVTSALNCLHLLFGAGHTARMVVGGPSIERDKRGSFRVVKGRLTFWASYGGPGEVGFNEDWMELLDDDEAQVLLKLCGVALEAASDPRLERPLSDRFLDASHWYGEAVRETSSAAKVIKYVTALERMFMTDEKDNIIDTMSQRIATFCSDPSASDDFSRWEADARRAYDLRSKLAHGSMSPRDPAVYEGVRLGSEVGRAALLSGLAAFEEPGLRQQGMTRKEIARWFQSCVQHGDAVRAHFNAKTKP